MSEYAYDYRTLLAGSAELDRMKQEIICLISMVAGLVDPNEVFEVFKRRDMVSIWQGSMDRSWKVSLQDFKISNVCFFYGGEKCMELSLQKGQGMTLPFGPHYIKHAHEHLHEFLDGMLEQFGASLGERLKLFASLGKRSISRTA